MIPTIHFSVSHQIQLSYLKHSANKKAVYRVVVVVYMNIVSMCM
jgi:hypothetical protein